MWTECANWPISPGRCCVIGWCSFRGLLTSCERDKERKKKKKAGFFVSEVASIWGLVVGIVLLLLSLQLHLLLSFLFDPKFRPARFLTCELLHADTSGCHLLSAYCSRTSPQPSVFLLGVRNTSSFIDCGTDLLPAT